MLNRSAYRALWALTILVVSIGVAAQFSSVRVLVLALVNGSPQCSMGRTLADWQDVRASAETTARILEKSLRVLKTDQAGFSLWETPRGYLWVPSRSGAPITVLAETDAGIYGRPPCSPGDIVIDCGAHVGIYTRYALQHGASLVIAVEPAPENNTCLKRNLAAEIASGRVVVVDKAIWDHEANLSFATSRTDSGEDHVTVGGVGSISVSATTIDHIVAEHALRHVDVIKMDIEGSERHALLGAQATLSHFHPKLRLAAYHLPGDPEAFQDIVQKAAPAYRMRCFLCLPETGRITPQVVYFD